MRTFFFLIFVGCGGVTAGSIDGDGGGGGDDGGGPSRGCPVSAPSIGSGCSTESLECEYGNDPRWSCNTVTRCKGGAWSKVQSNDSTCPTPATNPAACPASRTQASGACSVEGTACNYEGHWCACGFNGGPWMIDGGNSSWQCGGGTFASCPATRPHIGSACPKTMLECDYGVCGLPQGLSVECGANTLTWVSSAGPVCAKAD